MKNAIEFLKKDRKVNGTFIEKLKNVGLEIEYGKYNYWDNQPYIRIGREKVWLVCSKTESGSTYLADRYQNNVINDIVEAIEEEVKYTEKADAKVEEFFQKLCK